MQEKRDSRQLQTTRSQVIIFTEFHSMNSRNFSPTIFEHMRDEFLIFVLFSQLFINIMLLIFLFKQDFIKIYIIYGKF